LIEQDRQQRRNLNPEEEHVEIQRLVPLAEKLQLLVLQQSFLVSLDYDMRTSRAQTIKPAHVKTFQWIFKNSDATDGSSSAFLHWLEEEGGIFWITGKPGSGKSTLMVRFTLYKRHIDRTLIQDLHCIEISVERINYSSSTGTMDSRWTNCYSVVLLLEFGYCHAKISERTSTISSCSGLGSMSRTHTKDISTAMADHASDPARKYYCPSLSLEY
jgi:ABC-type polysaccharide/polyol phosphate transport system ATPase subunit